jgi:hypothetical protein
VQKKILQYTAAFLMAVIMAVGIPALVMAKDFQDVQSDAWYYPAISKWSGDAYSVLSGDENGLFHPNTPMTVAEMSTVLAKTFGYSAKAEIVKNRQGKWYSDAFAQAVAAGVVPADANPENVLTRQVAVYYLARAFSVSPLETRTTFIDDLDISSRYAGYVAAFQRAGWVVGMGNGKFEPGGSFTRAQIMSLMNVILSDIADKNVTGKTYAASLIVRKTDVVLTKTTIKGDLIIGQGVGDGDVTLDNVTVKGKLIVYGGGSHSIIIKGGSQIAYAVFNKQGGEPANLRVERGSTVTALEINAGSHARVSGYLAEINVSANATLEIAAGAIIDKVEIDGENVRILVREGSTAQIITINGDSVIVQGQGHVAEVVVAPGISDVQVGTQGTKITNNGTGVVKTGDGGVASGGTATTTIRATPTPAPTSRPSSPSTPSSPGTPTPTSTPVPTGTPSQPSSVTVRTLDELRDALKNPDVVTINVSVNLENTDADIIIPSGKTVKFAETAGLRVRNLEVNGTLLGSDSENAFNVLYVGRELSGSGLNAGNQNGFFGINAAYTPHFWVWYTAGSLVETLVETTLVETTGWWPTSVVVESPDALPDALAVDTIGEVHLNGTFSVESSFSIKSLHIGGDITISSSAALEVDVVVMFDGDSLTVNGDLKGVRESSEILLRGNSSLTLNGVTYAGPDPAFFSYNIARVLPWTGSVWGTPYLYNVDTGVKGIYTDLITLDDMPYLAKTYPELEGVHIYGNRFAFDSSYELTLTVPLLIHGNQTFGFGEDANTIEPVKIGAGITLTIADGATVFLVSDSADLNAIIGTDGTSRIVVENGAVIQNRQTGDSWPAGIYVWDTNKWK